MTVAALIAGGVPLARAGEPGPSGPSPSAGPAAHSTPWHEPRAAYADEPTVPAPGADAVSTAGPAVTVSPTTANSDSYYTGAGSGFTPGSTVQTRVEVDGKEYASHYTKTHSVDSHGNFVWGWVWDRGDPLGTYTYIATDVSGAVAQTTFTITASTGPPAAESGSSLMFDAASAPDLDTMHAWLDSPYRTVGVYVPVAPGTDDRHDKKQVNLTASWVTQVGAEGWHVLPIYLGVQAPEACLPNGYYNMADDPDKARQQGVDAADYAADQVAALGIPRSLPVTYDMEPYATGCSAAVAAFLDGWTTELHRAGRLAGVYGTQTTVMADLSAHLGDATYREPDDVWVATDDRTATTTGFSSPPDGSFTGHRLNQFHLDVDRTYGGVTLDIDETAINDDVLTGTPPAPTPPSVVADRLPAVTLAPRVTTGWSGTPGHGKLASYDVRTRSGTWRTRLSGWTYPGRLQATTSRSTTLKLSPGSTHCVQVRARDQDGRTSSWSASSCTTRPIDDRKLAGHGWTHQHDGAAYLDTVSSATAKGAVLRVGRVRTDRVGLVLVGRDEARIEVTLAGHVVGRVGPSTGTRSRVVWLPAGALRTGTLVLRITRGGLVHLDGVVLRSR